MGRMLGEPRNLNQLMISEQWLLNYCIYEIRFLARCREFILASESRFQKQSGVGFTSGEIGEFSGWVLPDFIPDWESYHAASLEYEQAVGI